MTSRLRAAFVGRHTPVPSVRRPDWGNAEVRARSSPCRSWQQYQGDTQALRTLRLSPTAQGGGCAFAPLTRTRP
eukprot:1470734-Alexandrium_andersonii.AAC.1